jgi:hypothetical protein
MVFVSLAPGQIEERNPPAIEDVTVIDATGQLPLRDMNPFRFPGFRLREEQLTGRGAVSGAIENGKQANPVLRNMRKTDSVIPRGRPRSDGSHCTAVNTGRAERAQA